MTAGERLAAADVLAKVKAKEEKAAVVLDANLVDVHEDLEVELARVDESDHRRRHELAEQILAIEEQIAESTVTFVCRGIGRARWRKLQADHPLTDEERAAGRVDGDEFMFHALAASVIEPRFTVEDFRELNGVLNEMQWIELWAACAVSNYGPGSARPESQAARALIDEANGRHKLQQPSDSALAEVS